MLIYDGGILRTAAAIALNIECCCVVGTCCPTTIPTTPGVIPGQMLTVFCINFPDEEVCACTWTWNGTEWILTEDSCS